MSYYRAALAAAQKGDKTAALRFVQCSIASKEDAPSALRLFHILRVGTSVDLDSLKSLRRLTENSKFKKALKVKLPYTSKSRTIRGLLYAQLGRRLDARREFALALAMDTGNDLARRALDAMSLF